MYVVKRNTHNPLISPSDGGPWEARGTFNPSPVRIGKKVHVLYRALGKPDVLMTPAGISTICKATTSDGNHFRNRRQLLIPEEPWEHYGCEDPRVTFFERRYVIFYTALGGIPFGPGNIKVGCALSKDLESIDERHLVTPFNAKAMALFPERIPAPARAGGPARAGRGKGGKVAVIFTAHTDEPPARIAIAECEELEDLWDPKFWEKWHANIESHTINPLRSDRDHVEVGAPPIKTKEGWLLFYSYIQNYFGGGDRVFGVEALLLDLTDPKKIIGRTPHPILVPEEVYERYGAVPNIVFPSGALMEKNNRVEIYYGAADTVCAKASLHLPDLLDAMLPERRKSLVIRAKENPILKPLPRHDWEKKAIFNAGAIDLRGEIHLLYRAMGDDNTSVFGYAATKDGVHISTRLPKPVYVPREEFEMKRGDPRGNSGCEDPRITKMGERIYMTYTAYDGRDPTRVAVTSISTADFLEKRFEKWARPLLITPEHVNDKNFCLLPEKIGGKYMLLHRIGPMLCADFLDNVEFKKPINRCIEIMGPRKGSWDSQKIGIAGPPIKTRKGWLLIYHGLSEEGVYRLGAALLDLKNPTVVLSRTADAIFEPRESYERVGLVPNVVFSCGAIRRDDTLFIYYGGADRVLGVATVSLKALLKRLAPKFLA